jgi:hypothetical protein
VTLLAAAGVTVGLEQIAVNKLVRMLFVLALIVLRHDDQQVYSTWLMGHPYSSEACGRMTVISCL